jgi:hypothetical protein
LFRILLFSSCTYKVETTKRKKKKKKKKTWLEEEEEQPLYLADLV